MRRVMRIGMGDTRLLRRTFRLGGFGIGVSRGGWASCRSFERTAEHYLDLCIVNAYERLHIQAFLLYY